jgi:hypothetical protein
MIIKSEMLFRQNYGKALDKTRVSLQNADGPGPVLLTIRFRVRMPPICQAFGEDNTYNAVMTYNACLMCV